MYRILFALALLIPLNVIAACPPHDAMGEPGPADRTLCRLAFYVGYDDQGRIPLWVMMRMTRESVIPKLPRLDRFQSDPELPSFVQAQNEDFYHSGYDRGHLPASASVDYSLPAMAQSYLLSAIAPQHPDLNRRGWLTIEKQIRRLAITQGPVHVVVGTWDDPDIVNVWLKGRVRVPDYFYVAAYAAGSRKAIAYLVPNEPLASSDVRKRRISVDNLEAIVGLDFFSRLKDPTEVAIEQTISYINFDRNYRTPSRGLP